MWLTLVLLTFEVAGEGVHAVPMLHVQKQGGESTC